MFTVQPPYKYDYEDLQPGIETTDTPESHLLHVTIPDGFARSEFGAKVEYDFGRVRVFGERSSGSNKRSRFNINYQVPSYCDIRNIRGKVDGKIITITMPIIPGAKVPPKQEQEPTQQPEPVVQETQPKDQGTDGKKSIPPQSTKEDDAAAAAAAEVKDQKVDQEEDTSKNQEPKSAAESKEGETSTPQDEQKVTMPQKGQEEISQKGEVTKVESKEEADHETSTPQDEQKVPIPQKGKEEISQKGEVTKFESKGEVDHETSTTQESIPQKGQEKDAATRDAKLQTEENTARFEKEETKDHLKKTTTVESGKQHVVDDSPTSEKEIKEESKGPDARVESVTTTRHIEKEKGKEMNGNNIGDDAEKKSDIKGITELTRTRIKDMAASTTKAVTSFAKRLNEDDKQKLIYTGAAILVVGLSVYASYKYRSSRRP